jgi:hypothetical protein
MKHISQNFQLFLLYGFKHIHTWIHILWVLPATLWPWNIAQGFRLYVFEMAFQSAIQFTSKCSICVSFKCGNFEPQQWPSYNITCENLWGGSSTTEIYFRLLKWHMAICLGKNLQLSLKQIFCIMGNKIVAVQTFFLLVVWQWQLMSYMSYDCETWYKGKSQNYVWTLVCQSTIINKVMM